MDQQPPQRPPNDEYVSKMKTKRLRKLNSPIPKVLQVMFPKETVRLIRNEFGLYIYKNFVLDDKTKQVVGKYLGDGRIDTNLTDEDILLLREIKLC